VSDRDMSCAVELNFPRITRDRLLRASEYLAGAGYPTVMDALVRRGFAREPLRPHATIGRVSVSPHVASRVQASQLVLPVSDLKLAGLGATTAAQAATLGVPVLYLRTAPSSETIGLQETVFEHLRRAGAELQSGVSIDGSFHVSVCTKIEGAGEATPEDLDRVAEALTREGVGIGSRIPIGEVRIADIYSDWEATVATLALDKVQILETDL
jgi:hypothetical protein